MQNTAFLLLTVFSTACIAAQPSPPTARQIVSEIQQHLGISLPADTVDTFKAGDPDTPVTGIAVTMMATFDVIRQAAERGDNFVITHEPTFYNHRDSTAALESQADAVLREKQAFIAQHYMVVWRFHDGWHTRHPDGILQGMTPMHWGGRSTRAQVSLTNSQSRKPISLPWRCTFNRSFIAGYCEW